MPFRKPIGGEQWFDVNLFNNSLNNFENTIGTFLSGGQSSLNFIVKSLEIRPDEYILLPAYLCPTIVWNFDRNKVSYDFYKINFDLSIDKEDLQAKIEKHNVRAVFFIDYFGFYHDSKTLDYLSSLKNNRIALIEDAAQMLWLERKGFIGDYIFNSYRKFLPIDGSIVLSETTADYEGVQDEYYEYVNMARMKITAYAKYGLGTVEEFAGLFAKAEKAYGNGTQINGMMEISRYLLNKVDVDYIGKVRRNNFSYLFDRLSGLESIKPLIDKKGMAENIPLGFPILIRNRDRIKMDLRSKAIYCASHWPILEEKWVHGYKGSLYLAKNILTLPIDQRYGTEDLDRLVRELLYLSAL